MSSDATGSASRDPVLSVVLVVGPRRERAADALASVLAQADEVAMEVLVVDCEPPATPALAGADHPAVRVFRLPGDTTFGAARATAARAARAGVVAFLEEHARALPGWAAAVVEAHRGPWAAVGYEVHNANAEVGRGWISGVMSYGLFAPPMERGESHLVSGHNSAYKRDVLLGFGAELDRLLLVDLGLGARLRREGHRFFLEPAARIEHLNETTLAASCRAYRSYHRLYGAARAREEGWSWRRRCLYVVAAPLIPFYYLVRFSRFLARRRPADLPRFLANAPYILVAQLTGAVSQAAGILRGPGDAARRFSVYEVSEPRPALPNRGPHR